MRLRIIIKLFIIADRVAKLKNKFDNKTLSFFNEIINLFIYLFYIKLG